MKNTSKMKSRYSKEMESKARKFALDIFKDKYGEGEKIDLWVCGDLILPSSGKAKCYECGRICYYDKKNISLATKNHRKICLTCALKNHSEELNPIELDIINEALK